jgi:hypothetical protein
MKYRELCVYLSTIVFILVNPEGKRLLTRPKSR